MPFWHFGTWKIFRRLRTFAIAARTKLNIKNCSDCRFGTWAWKIFRRLRTFAIAAHTKLNTKNCSDCRFGTWVLYRDTAPSVKMVRWTIFSSPVVFYKLFYLNKCLFYLFYRVCIRYSYKALAARTKCIAWHNGNLLFFK